MRLQITLAVAALVTTLVALPSVAVPMIVYTMKIVERHDPTCRLSRSDPFSCAYVRFEYPEIKRAPTPAAGAALNRAIRDYLVTGWGEPTATIDEAADTVMRELEYERRGNRADAYWLDDTIAILYESPPIVSVKFDSRSFLGGAHPNHTATFASFNATTLAKITLEDVLVAGYQARLTRIAENAFRAQHDIKPGMTLHDAGYPFFKNDTFALNDNFWFDPRA